MRLRRALAAAWRAYRAALPEPPPVVPETVTELANALEALRALVPALTAEEVVRAIEKFSNERAPTHPAEAVYFVLYIERFAAGIAPFVAKLTESQPTPPAPPGDGPVN